jgi:hypothetical protein
MFKRGGRQRKAGLGSALAVPLAKARDIARELRETLAAGGDPVEARKTARKAASSRRTFGEVADALIAAKESGWTAGHAKQWRFWLQTYGAALRDLPVDAIDTEAALAVLTSLWQSEAGHRVVMILDLHRQGLSVSAIARQLCLNRKTVHRAIAKGLEPPKYKTRAPRSRITDPFEPYLKERLAAYPGPTAVRLWREFKERGYAGELQRSQRLRARPAAAALGRLRSPL